MRILCTGYFSSTLNSSLAMLPRLNTTPHIQQLDFECRHSHTDLTTTNGMMKFIGLSKNYDVVINCARLTNYWQSILLINLWQQWNMSKKSGHIISMGSDILYKIGTNFLHDKNNSYVLEKEALQTAHRKYCLMSSKIKMTLLQPGRMDKDKHISPDYIVSIILWILNQPQNININELVLSEVK